MDIDQLIAEAKATREEMAAFYKPFEEAAWALDANLRSIRYTRAYRSGRVTFNPAFIERFQERIREAQALLALHHDVTRESVTRNMVAKAEASIAAGRNV